MPERVEVLIAGGGPVGTTLAMDLGWRGVPCLLVEQNPGPPINPRCNTTAARSMEHFRRLGVADRVREAGLPDDFPTNVEYRTRLREDAHLLVRFDLPPSSVVRAGGGVDEDEWPTPEPQHRIAQIYLEPILAEHAQTFPDVRFERGMRLVSFEHLDDGVLAQVEDVQTGAIRTVECGYLVGCDGSHSAVRHGMGVRYEGVPEISNVVSMYFRSPELLKINPNPAWMTFSYYGEAIGNTIAVDGKELWLNHNIFPAGTDTSELDPGELLARSLGTEIEYEQLGLVRWTARALVAERYRDERVFLAGDAAHIWIGMAGFGMNSGIQDAAALGWKLSAVHHGWAGPSLLDAYEAERRPIGDQIARAAHKIASKLLSIDGLDRLEDPGPEGEEARARVASLIKAADQRQFNPVGLNFGYHYHGSDIVWSEEPPPPPLEVDVYEPSAQPGCRLPHIWLAAGVSIFDRLGPDFTLLRIGSQAPSGGRIIEAARGCGMPLDVLDVTDPAAIEVYGARLVLVRPDQHVAWRGDEDPPAAREILDRVRGASATRDPELQEVAS